MAESRRRIRHRKCRLTNRGTRIRIRNFLISRFKFIPSATRVHDRRGTIDVTVRREFKDRKRIVVGWYQSSVLMVDLGRVVFQTRTESRSSIASETANSLKSFTSSNSSGKDDDEKDSNTGMSKLRCFNRSTFSRNTLYIEFSTSSISLSAASTVFRLLEALLPSSVVLVRM
uniref:Uncharacterized protein n=2 Tax=Vespula TaxID=7451 RepID=A0A834UAA9_VESPE|nr:hypothetical protein H0235_007986 [Vespula pensylvanica]